MVSITITGDLGSGKTSVAQILSKALGYEVESIGKLQRDLASQYQMNITEFNKYMEIHPEIDNKLDLMITEMGRDELPKIFDSRLAWHFIPKSFKVFLHVNLDIAVERICRDKKRTNEDYNDLIIAKQNIIERQNSEQMRFKEQYNVNLRDFKNYNLIVDTSYSAPDEVVEIILEGYHSYLQNITFPNVWLSPRLLIPCRNIREYSERYTSPISASIRTNGYRVDRPVYVLLHNNNYYIYDGHKRTCAALFNKCSLVPVVIMNTLPNCPNVGVYIESHFRKSDLYDWEDLHQLEININ